jgi:neutral ceramidase
VRKLLAAILLAAPLWGQFRAGVARVNITPQTPAWLSGFAARTRPAETVAQELWAKALVLDDAKGSRFVLVTADLIGFTREITDDIAARVQMKYRLERRQILFNASHTHSGPSVWPRLHVARGSDPGIEKQLKAYATKLTNDIEEVIGRAAAAMQPARLEFAHAQATFAINRRVEHLSGVRPGETFPAPVDPSVPVLHILSSQGSTLGIVFGYACHNTVLTAEFNEVSGDYAGHAQQMLEEEFPSSVAMFVALCAGDQRASQRSKKELAEQHGRSLAQAVAQALRSKPTSIAGLIESSYEVTVLPFQAHTRETYLAESKSTDTFLARRGRLMLEAYDAKKPVHSTPYPVQAVRFGNGPVWVALGGEVVIDYQLRLKAEFGADRVVVLGYSNDVMGYIPSKRVQREGGYEAGDAMMYFSQPGWFSEEVEDIVLSASRRVLAAVGLKVKH